MYNFQNSLSAKGWPLLFLRLALGFGFVAHGWAKLDRGPDNFAVILLNLGVPFAHAAAWITTILEFAGGLSIMAGGFVTFFSIPLAVVMLTAMLTVHLPYGFSTVKLKAILPSGPQFGSIGYELNVLYIAGLSALVMGGSGPFSIDKWLRSKKK